MQPRRKRKGNWLLCFSYYLDAVKCSPLVFCSSLLSRFLGSVGRGNEVEEETDPVRYSVDMSDPVQGNLRVEIEH